MRLIFMGTPEFAVPALQALAGAHQIAAVFTRAPKPAGRGQAPRPSPVALAAAALNLPVLTPLSLRGQGAAVAAFHADLAVVVAYGLLLPPEVLAAPRLGCLNIHASLLPRWRGAAPIQRAILARDAETGISIMQMGEGLDNGPVLLARSLPIGAAETAGQLHDRLALLGAELILQTLDRLPLLTPRPQEEEAVTWAAKITKAEAALDWTRPAAEVDAQIRALSPFPGAWAMLGGHRVKFLASALAPGDGPPGTRTLGPGLAINCAGGAVAVTRLQREGRAAMEAAEFLRGLALNPGAALAP